VLEESLAEAAAAACTREYHYDPEHFRERTRPVLFTEELQRSKGPRSADDPALSLPEKQRWWNTQFWVPEFRITRECFYFILENIRAALEHEAAIQDPNSPPVSPAEALAIALYFLARGGYLKATADAMGRSRATVSRCVASVCRLIWHQLHGSHIKFPSSTEQLIQSVRIV